MDKGRLHGNLCVSASLCSESRLNEANWLWQRLNLITSCDGSVSLEVLTDADAVWLNRRRLSELFGRDVKTFGKHVANALWEELADEAVVVKFATTAADGKVYETAHYNPDLVLPSTSAD